MKALPLALLALAALQGEAPLRRTLKEGTDTYKMEAKVVQTVSGPMGEIPMNITSLSTYAVKTTKVDDAAGTALVEATTTVDKLDADGPMAAMVAQQKPKPITQTGKMDVRGRLTFDKSAGGGLTAMLSGAQATASAGTFVEFPEKPVKVGDSWEIVVPKSPLLLDQDQKLTAKLVGEKDLDGTPVWVVSVGGTIKTAVDTTKLPKEAQLPDGPMGPMNMVLKGEMALTGEGLVEKATGKTLSMTTKATSKSNIELASLGMTIDSSGTIESKVTLQKGP